VHDDLGSGGLGPAGVRPLFGGRASWHHWSGPGAESWFSGYLLDPQWDGTPAAEALARRLAGIATEDLPAALAVMDGRFAFVLRQRGRVVAAVDRVRTVPLFVAETAGTDVVGPDALGVRGAAGLGPADLDEDAALPLAMSGYTLGSRTLYRGLRQLRAGELVVWEGAGASWRRWYRYEPWSAKASADPTEAAEALASIVRRACERLAASAGDRPILVPLSAGLDSRLIVSGLREVGFDRVTAFAYGHPGNHEAATSRQVAARLGVPWFFMPVTHRDMARRYAAPEFEAFLDFADTCAGTPMLQEYGVAAALREAGWADRGALLVNGQTGDFISGGHAPVSLALRDGDPGPGPRRAALLQALVAKHYSLWQALRTPDRLERLGHLLLDDLDTGLPDPMDLPASLDWSLFEHSEWQNRQSQYVVSGQRTYEHFGFGWRLPLWDAELMDFFQALPVELKLGQRLWKDTLQRCNWGGVWRDLPVRTYVSPRWVRVVRPVLKGAVGVAGRQAWHAVDHRLFAYWMEMHGQIALVSYRTARRDQRGWRHAVSYVTEHYLARHGLDWTGTVRR